VKSAHAELVSAFVDTLLRSGDLHTEAVERASRRVRRHEFLDHWYRLESSNSLPLWSRVDFDQDGPDPQILSTIYSDRSLVTGIAGDSPTTSTSQPRLMARMLEALDLGPGMRVLEIGTGTGYNTALLAETPGDPASIYSVELRPEVSKQAGEALFQEGYADVRLFAREGALGGARGCAL